MYERFYGLTQNPFGISPNPAFYYATMRHNEALANLTYGVLMQRGFIVLTGEVGTGKSLLVRCLLETLQRSRVVHAYIFNPMVSSTDLLRLILVDFGVRDPKPTRGEMLQQFNEFLIDVYRRGGVAALIIDEAHLLSMELLEELRLMTNIETSQHKLLQILLVGQPELDSMLDSLELRAMKQRVALRYSLEPLDEMEVRGYIEKRLELAGAPGRALQIFPPPTLARILHYSQGIPRLINTICDSALINGYGRQMKSITPAIIDETANDLRLGFQSSASKLSNEGKFGFRPEEDGNRQMLVRTLLRLATMLEPGLAEEVDRKHSQGASGL